MQICIARVKIESTVQEHTSPAKEKIIFLEVLSVKILRSTNQLFLKNFYIRSAVPISYKFLVVILYFLHLLLTSFHYFLAIWGCLSVTSILITFSWQSTAGAIIIQIPYTWSNAKWNTSFELQAQADDPQPPGLLGQGETTRVITDKMDACNTEHHKIRSCILLPPPSLCVPLQQQSRQSSVR